MNRIINLTEAKAKFSEIINKIIYNKKKIFITKNGKKVAAIIPMEDLETLKKEELEGLILAKGALSDMDDEIEQMSQTIYENRFCEKGHEVSF